MITFIAKEYDIAVIGAGHAGCEAALAAARLGKRTALFTISLDSVANMPCNPSIGGTAKGHIVREIDALGGEMGRAADATMLQSRNLPQGQGFYRRILTGIRPRRLPPGEPPGGLPQGPRTSDAPLQNRNPGAGQPAFD